jgi:hypothetical protein
MAEIIGPFGFCFGAIGFVLGTLPTIAKAGKTYLECAEHFSSLETRAIGIESKYRTLEITYRSFQFEKHKEKIENSRKYLQDLSVEINDTLTRREMSDEERASWDRRRDWLQRIFQLRIKSKVQQNAETKSWDERAKRKWNKLSSGALRMLPAQDAKFHRSFTYVIWKDKIIEGWLTRMDDYVKGMNEIAALQLRLSSDNQVDGSSGENEIRQITGIKKFVDLFSALAETLRNQCNTIQSACGWAFGLGSLSTGFDINKLASLDGMDIKLRFSTRILTNTEHCELRVPFDKINTSTHDGAGRAKQAIVDWIASGGDMTENSSPSIDPVCKLDNRHSLMEKSVGQLFRDYPDYFQRELNKDGWKRWRRMRSEIVHSLLDLAIVLWGTEWTRKLCCSGIHLENRVFERDEKQTLVFLAEEHNPNCAYDHQDHCVKSLGLLLAEVLLAKPVRLSIQGGHDRYEIHVGSSRSTTKEAVMEVITLQALQDMIFNTTFSNEMGKVVREFLTKDSELVTTEYRTSLLYWYSGPVSNR